MTEPQPDSAVVASAGSSWSTHAKIALVALGFVFLLALTARLYPVLSQPEERRGGFGIFGDTYLYHQIAFNLADGKGFSGTYDGRFSKPRPQPPPPYEPAITRGPVYPFFISLIYRFLVSDADFNRRSSWPENLNQIRTVQAVVDALNCFVVFAVTRAMFPRSLIPAILAALIFAFCPYNIYYTRTILKEALATSLLTATMLFSVLSLGTQRYRWYALAGAGIALTALCIPQFLLFPPLFAAAILVMQRATPRPALARATLHLLAAICVIAPWTFRNHVVFDDFIPVSRGALGYNLFLGTFESNTNWTGWNEFPEEIFQNEAEKAEILAARDRFLKYYSAGNIKVTEPDRFFLQLAIRRFLENPVESIKLGIIRMPRLWYQLYIPMYADREASGFYFALYFFFAAFAFFACGRRVRMRMSPVVLMFLYLSALYLPLHVEPRMGVPIIPGIICMTAIGVFLFVSSLRSLWPSPARQDPRG